MQVKEPQFASIITLNTEIYKKISRKSWDCVRALNAMNWSSSEDWVNKLSVAFLVFQSHVYFWNIYFEGERVGSRGRWEFNLIFIPFVI